MPLQAKQTRSPTAHGLEAPVLDDFCSMLPIPNRTFSQSLPRPIRSLQTASGCAANTASEAAAADKAGCAAITEPCGCVIHKVGKGAYSNGQKDADWTCLWNGSRATDSSCKWEG